MAICVLGVPVAVFVVSCRKGENRSVNVITEVSVCWSGGGCMQYLDCVRSECDPTKVFV